MFCILKKNKTYNICHIICFNFYRKNNKILKNSTAHSIITPFKKQLHSLQRADGRILPEAPSFNI